MRHRVRPAPCCAAIALALSVASPAARANGVFPNAGQIIVDPADPLHVVVRTTYGVLTTRAGGEPWDWICESAVGYGSGFHPAVAFTQNSTLIAGLPDGLATAGGDTCSWSKAGGGLDGAVVVDVSVEKSDLSHAVLVTSGGPSGAGQFWTSDDNAATWVKTGSNLPAGFVPLAIDVAPSDPNRVYVTALTGGAGTKKGTLMVSDDRGATWSPFSVPNTDVDHAPYIGGVDPLDADRLFVRNDGVPGRLFLFDRAAGTFTQIFSGESILRGFAISPDGATLLAGGSTDGIWRAPSDTLAFEKRSDVATRCLTWTAGGVYTCATEFVEGFTIGLSTDEALTFQPVMHLPCVRGPLECGAATTVAVECPSRWAAVALQIGADQCQGSGGSGGGSGGNGASSGTGAGGGGGAGAGAGAAAGGAGAGAGAGGVGSNGSGADGSGAGTGSGASASAGDGGGCACHLAGRLPGDLVREPAGDTAHSSRAPSPRNNLPPPAAGTFAAVALALLVFRRGRRRATPRA